MTFLAVHQNENEDQKISQALVFVASRGVGFDLRLNCHSSVFGFLTFWCMWKSKTQQIGPGVVPVFGQFQLSIKSCDKLLIKL